MAVAGGAARLAAPCAARPGGAAAPGSRSPSRRHGDRVLRLANQVALAGVADVERARAPPRQLPDLAQRQPQRPAPERLLPRLQRARELPRQPRRLADELLLQAHLGRHDRARRRSSCCASAAAVRRSACSRRSRRFAAMGLWEPSMRTFALTFASVALSLAIGLPLGVLAGRSDRVPARDHAGARRDADRPRLRVPDADRASSSRSARARRS